MTRLANLPTYCGWLQGQGDEGDPKVTLVVTRHDSRFLYGPVAVAIAGNGSAQCVSAIRQIKKIKEPVFPACGFVRSLRQGIPAISISQRRNRQLLFESFRHGGNRHNCAGNRLSRACVEHASGNGNSMPCDLPIVHRWITSARNFSVLSMTGTSVSITWSGTIPIVTV